VSRPAVSALASACRAGHRQTWATERVALLGHMPAAHLASAYHPTMQSATTCRNPCERRTGRHPRRGHPACAASSSAVLQFLDDAVLGALRARVWMGLPSSGLSSQDGSKMSLLPDEDFTRPPSIKRFAASGVRKPSEVPSGA